MAAENDCDCVDHDAALINADTTVFARLAIVHQPKRLFFSRSVLTANCHQEHGVFFRFVSRTVVKAKATRIRPLVAFLRCKTTVRAKLSWMIRVAMAAVSTLTANASHIHALRSRLRCVATLIALKLHKLKLLKPVKSGIAWRASFKHVNIEANRTANFNAATKSNFLAGRSANLKCDDIACVAGIMAFAMRTIHPESQEMVANTKLQGTTDENGDVEPKPKVRIEHKVFVKFTASTKF